MACATGWVVENDDISPYAPHHGDDLRARLAASCAAKPPRIAACASTG
jgi:hypothetical protein